MLGEEIVKGISLAMSAILILLMVGALIGVWNMSGTIATVVYYGIQYINPTWFYFAAALLTGIIGIVTGSSWTTAATLGVAFVGMAGAIGASTAITAGAVISGAYFGDKMTPLSETTILTPQIVGSNVYAHIRSMSKASIPAYLIALAALFSDRPVQAGDAAANEHGRSAGGAGERLSDYAVEPAADRSAVGAWLSPLPGLSLDPDRDAGGRAGRHHLSTADLITFANDMSAPFAAVKSIWVAMANGFVLASPYPEINELFSGGGMSSMLYTVWLILGAMSFGAMMDFGGFNQRLITPVIQRVKSDGGTIATVMFTSVGFNIVAGDQYIAIVLPARMFMLTFRQRGLHPETLATAVENSGTVTSPLIPWNSCGAYMSAALGVSTFVYFPYCFFNFLNPLWDLVTALFVGINVQHLAEGEQPALEESAPGAAGGSAEVRRR